MTFMVGDKVLILAKTVPGHGWPVPHGTEGVITQTSHDSNVVSYFDIIRQEQQRFWFGHHLLDYANSHSPMWVEMELDEIELAENIMEGLK